MTLEWLDADAGGADTSGWDDVVEASGLVGTWRRSVLAAYARSGARETHLALGMDGNTPVALFCLVAGLSSLPTRRYVLPSTRPGVRPLLCRLPLSFTPGYHFLPGLAASRRTALLRELAAAVRFRFGIAVPAIGFLAVPASDAALFSWCPVSVDLSPVAIVDVPPGGAQEFLWAQGVRRRRRLVDAADRAQHLPVRSFSERATADPVVLSELDMATRLRHTPKRRVIAPLPLGVLEALIDAKAGLLFGAERPADDPDGPRGSGNGRLELFDLLLPGREEWLALTTGSQDQFDDRDAVATACFLAELDAVAASGARRLVLGPGSIPTKLRLGARASSTTLQLSLLSRSKRTPGWR